MPCPSTFQKVPSTKSEVLAKKQRKKKNVPFLPAKRSMPLPPRKNATSSQEEGRFLPGHSAPHHPPPFSPRAISLFTQSEQAKRFADNIFSLMPLRRHQLLHQVLAIVANMQFVEHGNHVEHLDVRCRHVEHVTQTAFPLSISLLITCSSL